ncbi:unnamed protein product [Musa textilis]
MELLFALFDSGGLGFVCGKTLFNYSAYLMHRYRDPTFLLVGSSVGFKVRR